MTEAASSSNVLRSLLAARAAVENDRKMQFSALYSGMLQEAPMGIGFVAALLSEQFPTSTFDSFLQYLSQGGGTSNRTMKEDASVLVLRIVSILCDGFYWQSWGADEQTEYFTAIDRLLQSATALSILVRSPRFTGTFASNGRALQMRTVFGSIISVGAVSSRLTPREEAFAALSMFPSTSENGVLDPAKLAEGTAQIERGLIQAHELCFPIIRRALGKAGSPREATLGWIARFYRQNKDFAKEFQQDDANLCTLTALTTMMNIMVSLALPVLQADGFVEGIPAEYVCDTKHALLQFAQDEERVGRFSEERPLPAPNRADPYAPKVELFFMALEAIRIAHSAQLQKIAMWKRQTSHPGFPALQKPFLRALAAFHEAHVSSAVMSRNISVLLNGLARWLLHTAGVNYNGELPHEVPVLWCALPQRLLSDIFVSVKYLSEQNVDFSTLYDIASLMLVFMGNLAYFPKPHTHAPFPELLLALLNNPSSRGMLENHQWFVSNILRCCINCYIAVRPCELEKSSARYYLSVCLRAILGQVKLCEPMRTTLEDSSNILLEKFTHMVASEAGGALEGAIEHLLKMKEMETQNNGVPAATDAYRQEGEQLRPSLHIFTAAIGVLGLLAKQFPSGVLRHLVALQIATLLVKSTTRLAGRDSGELKIAPESMEAYDFNPRKLLHTVVECLVNFRNEDKFLGRVPECGVALSDFRFACENILDRGLVGPPLDIDLQELLLRLPKKEPTDILDDEGLPDFALCSLLSVPLTDPVVLPQEQGEFVVVNLDSIWHHLLDNEQNPFTRTKMTIEDLEEFNRRPDVKAHLDSVKRRIQELKQDRGNKK